VYPMMLPLASRIVVFVYPPIHNKPHLKYKRIDEVIAIKSSP
jgi:hypothetical protein